MSVLSLRSAWVSILRIFVSSDSVRCNTGQAASQDYRKVIHDVLQRFMQNLDYHRPAIPAGDKLVGDLLMELRSWQVDDVQPESFYLKTAHTASGIAEICYPFHSYDIRKQIAMFTFLLLYMDDLCSTMPSVLAEVQRRILLGLPQLDPVVDHLPAHLAKFHNFYDPLCANAIVASGLDFVTGTALEVRKEVLDMKVLPEAKSWAIFLRDKTGISLAYAHMIFESTEFPNIADYLQAIPDINTYISLANDLFSFYKEELEGERHNYIHNRARCEGVTALQACADVADDCVALDQRICKILQSSGNPEALDRWQQFKTGYSNFHVTVPRYKLKEIGV